MKPISLDLFTNYSFLSDLQIAKDRPLAVFVQTKSDLEHNDYTQRLHVMNTETKGIQPLTDWRKRTASFLLN
ncbi:MAG: hypothetical protein J6K75_10065, partial [Erysipelotrichaceae bacterium]|nr:hypothetical protein [Erysipelotrichaceae bacterium]